MNALKQYKRFIIISFFTSLVFVFMVTVIPVGVSAKAKLSSKEIEVGIGDTEILKVKKTKKKIKWKSNNKKIVKVKKRGRKEVELIPQKIGSTTVTAQVGEKILKCHITVKAPAIKMNRILGTTSMTVGNSKDMFSLCNNLEYLSLSNKQKAQCFKWYCSDNNILSIDKFGRATAKQPGKVEVRFKVKIGFGASRTGNWKKSHKLTVHVLDDTNITYSINELGLNDTILNADVLELAQKEKRLKYNSVSVTINNNSEYDIIVDRYVGLYGYMVDPGEGIEATMSFEPHPNKELVDFDFDEFTYLYTKDENKVTIPKHTSTTILFESPRIYAVSHLDSYQGNIILGFKQSGAHRSIIYDGKTGTFSNNE